MVKKNFVKKPYELTSLRKDDVKKFVEDYKVMDRCYISLNVINL